MINKPVKTIRAEKLEIKNKKVGEARVKYTSKLNTIIVSVIVIFIFSYIVFDYFVIKQKIENKIMIVNEKFDSLQIYLNNKLPAIDNAIKIQEQQVKDLQEIKNTVKK